MRTTNISSFKANISRELRSVRAGERIVIVDRDIPVAEVIPFGGYAQRLPARPPKGRLVLRRLSISVAVDPLRFLMEERGRR